MDARRGDGIAVQVAYARPERQRVLSLVVPVGTTARQAVKASAIASVFPEIDPDVVPLGIYGRAVDGNQPLQEHDRIEVYRPLRVDPKEARRQRARLPR